MNLVRLQEQLLRLHSLISSESTGTPSEVAANLNVSERTAKGHIAALRELGASIGYCMYRRSYYYITPVNFKFGFESLTPDSMKTIKGRLWNINSHHVSNNLGIRHMEN
jgi:predicted DNA-binding transcriptional regulator YafY